MKIISVVGARPNFIKIAPFCDSINNYNSTNLKNSINHILLHTGQHYDDTMSKVFFEELNIPKPDINLGIGSGTHAEQVGKTMIGFEKILNLEKPDWVVVVGDVNATLSCSITAKKANIKVCHIEAGLRSRDLEMPEEINRLVTDRLSDLLLTPDKFSSKNLLNEGAKKEKVVFVGNIMVDTLEKNKLEASNLDLSKILKNKLISRKHNQINKYALVTLHRPSNVDNIDCLQNIIDLLINFISREINVLWPIHPRTLKQLKKFDLLDKVIDTKNINLLDPLSYNQMLKLNLESTFMLTDSGGLQEECSVLGTPCLTLRSNTERPITLKSNEGTSVLVGNNIDKMKYEIKNILSDDYISSVSRPEKWDGKTADRCLEAILKYKL